MITIKIDEKYTPELRKVIMDLIREFNVVSFSTEDDSKPRPPEVRPGANGKDLASGLSAAVDRASHGK